MRLVQHLSLVKVRVVGWWSLFFSLGKEVAGLGVHGLWSIFPSVGMGSSAVVYLSSGGVSCWVVASGWLRGGLFLSVSSPSLSTEKVVGWSSLFLSSR